MSRTTLDDAAPADVVTVCLVEDHEALRHALASLIVQRGDRVVASVGTVAAGLDAVLMLRPTVAVVDNQLPDGRGVDLCRTLAAAAPEVALILHSGVVSPELEAQARAVGVAAVVTKSARGAELLAALDDLRLRRAVTGDCAGP